MHKRWIWPFELEEQIGAGAMGVVYRARYVKNDRKVALKLLPDDIAANSSYSARFERELEILKDLRHPNIVHCFGGTCDGAQRFYAMELVEGGSLQDLLADRGFLPWAEVVEFGQQVCSALAYAHEQGIIHRDLKPGNLLITKGGKLKLSDFGLALIAAGNKLTAEGKTMGTLHYMSPEQIRGNPPLTSQSDLYALGCMLFEMLTGRAPFEGETAGQILHQHIHQPAPRVSTIAVDCPPFLEQLVADLLEKDPSRRPASAHVVAERLQAADSSETIAARRLEPSLAPTVASSKLDSASKVLPARMNWPWTAGLMLLTAFVVWLITPRTPVTPDARAQNLWIRALGDGSPAVRLAATRAMGQIGGENKSAVLPLARLLEDPDPQIRSEAALALGRLGFPAKPIMPLLVRAEKNDDDEHVRSQAAMALESIRAARPDGREKRFPWSICIVGVLLAGGAAAWARRDWIKAEWGPVVTRRLERMLP